MSDAQKPATSASSKATDKPSPEELLARAKAMVPVLAERAYECEKLGRLPDATNQAFEDEGFYRICRPALYGGYEYLPTHLYRVVIELAKGCPSSAWVLAVFGIHHWMTGVCDPRITEDILGEDNTTRFSTSLAPTGQAEKVDGGYILNGRWSWATGCDHARWVMPGAVTENDAGKKELIAFFVPRSDFEIDQDSWDTAGMRGTGSKTVVIKDAFVPDYRRHFVALSNDMKDPGRAKFTADAYKVSFGIAFSYCLAAVAIGAADGALEYCIEYARKRISAYDGRPYSGMTATQRSLGEVQSMVDGLHLKMNQDFKEMEDYIREDGRVPMERRALHRWHTAEISRMAKDAINLLVQSGGGSPFMNSNPLQRYFRDVNCIVNHRIVQYDEAAANYGYFLLTGESNAFLV